MKKIIVTLITLFALSAFAQTAETVEKAPLNYLKALQSSNDALVSSAIFVPALSSALVSASRSSGSGM